MVQSHWSRTAIILPVMNRRSFRLTPSSNPYLINHIKGKGRKSSPLPELSTQRCTNRQLNLTLETQNQSKLNKKVELRAQREPSLQEMKATRRGLTCDRSQRGENQKGNQGNGQKRHLGCAPPSGGRRGGGRQSPKSPKAVKPLELCTSTRQQWRCRERERDQSQRWKLKSP